LTKIAYIGDGRCAACVQADVKTCFVDRAIQQKWIEDWNTGIRRKKAPDGSACQTCAGLKKRCLLPAMAGFRAPVLKRKRGVGDEDETESEAEAKSVVERGVKSEEPAVKRVRLPPKVGTGGSAAASTSTSTTGSASVAVASAVQAATAAAASAEAALKNLRGVGRDVVASLRALNYLVAGLVRGDEGTLPRFLREELPEDAEGPDGDFVPEEVEDWEMELEEEFDKEVEVEDDDDKNLGRDSFRGEGEVVG